MVMLKGQPMATPFPLSQPSTLMPIAAGRSVHSTGDSNISSDLTIIGDVSSTGTCGIGTTVRWWLQ